MLNLVQGEGLAEAYYLIKNYRPLQAQIYAKNKRKVNIPYFYIYSFTKGSDIELKPEHQRLYSEKVIPVTYLESDNTTTKQVFAMNEVIEQTVSKAFNIRNTPVKSIQATNSDFFFINRNLLNDFYASIEKSNSYYFDQLLLSVTDKQKTITIFLIVSALTLAFSFLVFIPMFKRMTIEEFLFVKVFLSIPKEEIKSMLKNCEIFVNELQVSVMKLKKKRPFSLQNYAAQLYFIVRFALGFPCYFGFTTPALSSLHQSSFTSITL